MLQNLYLRFRRFYHLPPDWMQYTMQIYPWLVSPGSIYGFIASFVMGLGFLLYFIIVDQTLVGIVYLTACLWVNVYCQGFLLMNMLGSRTTMIHYLCMMAELLLVIMMCILVLFV
jgi:hypothetical protein